MWLSPSLIMFMISIFMSIAIIVSSPNMLISWVGLELNTLAFIPIILSNKHSLTSEASIKYFLTQTVASVLFLVASLCQNLNLAICFSSLLIISLSIKLGAAPFHSWLPSVVLSMNWSSVYLLLTLQKINPLLILGNSSHYQTLFLLIISLSLMIGAAQGLVQTSTRLILTFSSINHIGWMLTTTLYDLTLTFFYFGLYSLLLVPIVLIMYKCNISHINQLASLNLPLYLQPLIFLNLLSLGGLPPFLGFLPKWVILQNLITEGFLSISFLMILSSLVTLYFYLRITFSAFMMSNPKINLLFNQEQMNYKIIFFSIVSILGLALTYMV